MVGKTVCFVVKMKLIVATYLLSLIGVSAFAQHQNQLYHGNQSYMDGDLDQAQSYYQKALSGDPNIYEGNLNLGNTNFRKQDFESAITSYQRAAENSTDAVKKANAFHNLGNTYLQNQKIDEAIDAYKNALRTNPTADETRYNLAYAQNLKKQQEEQQNKDQDKENQDKDQQDKKDKNEDNKDQNKDKEEQDKEDKKDQQDQKEKSDQEKKQEQKTQPKPMDLSPREAEQMLEAAKNEDQMLQMKLRKQQAKTKNIDKDW
ncbi:MAG TPA: hypothetical protein DCR48_13350 [Flavobacteriales bacterium]|jgi:Ca-activated chloride channel homolog|nr:hypothetical protein [Flavobacteriales bacterium]